MPETPISLDVPGTCPHCGVTGRVQLQQTIQGNRVLLEWVCRACDHEWLVRHKDEHPERP
jgi:rubredoxin